MKGLRRLFVAVASLAAGSAVADSTPDVMHYVFAQTGATVANLASNPPMGTSTASIEGSLGQTGIDLNYAGNGHSLMGSGNSALTDYLNTGWQTNLNIGPSWTISFVSSNFAASSTLFYIFGDSNAGSFRCFTNGFAGPNNWILRGTNIADVLITNGATTDTHRTTFVYDASTSSIYGYLDGTLVTTVAQGTFVVAGTGPFKVMGYGSNVGAPAGGLLDDFRLYSRALSAAEVADLDQFSWTQVLGNNNNYIASGDTTPDLADGTDFGDVITDGALKATRTFTISNGGHSVLTLGSITLSGPAAADFTVTSPPSSTPLAPSETTTFDITFDPSADGMRSASVSFATSDYGNPAYAFAIQGNGLDVIFRTGFEDAPMQMSIVAK